MQMPLAINKVHLGDCLDVMRDMESESIDLVVTDPPYGYSFMGKDWDKSVPSVAVWKECIRILKSGAFAFIMSAPRIDVQSQMAIRLQQAGFRVDFTPIYWAYATGFPKAMNISKAVDKKLGVKRKVIGERPTSVFRKENGWHSSPMNDPGHTYQYTTASSEEAKAFDGSYASFQPKPAVEVIIVAMKPLSERTYMDQALKNRKGITWLDDCRIPCNKSWQKIDRQHSGCDTGHIRQLKKRTSGQRFSNIKGRFPANLLVSDDVLNDGKSLNKGSSIPNQAKRHCLVYGKYPARQGFEAYSDAGSFSRYFSLDRWFEERIKELPAEVQKVFPFLIMPKPSRLERNKGLQHSKFKRARGVLWTQYEPNAFSGDNIHPTVKPLKLISYLITLGSREKDIVLDPFAGSGTTCIAARMQERRFIGIEKEPEYHKIAEVRLKNSLRQLTLYEVATP